MQNFRSYREHTVEFLPGVNRIEGENGCGKTNILEAVHMLTCFKSFRTSSPKDMISHDCRSFSLEGMFDTLSGEKRIKTDVYADKSNVVSLNEERIYKLSSLYGEVVCIVFTPQNLDIVAGAPSERRNMLDMFIAQLSKAYIADLQEYSKILRQKATALKEEMFDTLPVWNEQLSVVGERIIARRAEYVQHLDDVSSSAHKIVAPSEELKILYKPNVEHGYLMDILCKYGQREINAQRCLVGIQRDDLVINVNGYNARNFASQGQKRTAVLSIKIAQMDIINDKIGEYPILLLDDVMSELDGKRRLFLAKMLDKSQTIITSADPIG